MPDSKPSGNKPKGKKLAPAAPRKRNPLVWIIPAAIVVAGILIFLSIQSAKKTGPSPPAATPGTPTTPAAPPTATTEPGIKLPPPEPSYVAVANQKGSDKAPVVIAEYADFQCPACGFFYKTIGRRLDEEFVATGQVRVVFHPYSFIGRESVRAAQAAFCAADEGKFWPYHDLLFENQGLQENGGAFSDARLKRFAPAAGLDATKFNECFDSNRHAANVDEERNTASIIGVTTTPTIFINSRRFVGSPRSYEDFRALVLDALHAAGAKPAS